jgi:hypothetical protein
MLSLEVSELDQEALHKESNPRMRIELFGNTKSELGAVATSRTLSVPENWISWLGEFHALIFGWSLPLPVLILFGAPLRNHARHFLCKGDLEHFYSREDGDEGSGARGKILEWADLSALSTL